MLFNSIKYALFLPVVAFLFWICPQRLRVPLLLIASYVFYMSWRPIYILLILGLTVGNYLAGLLIASQPARKKFWMILSVTANLLVLAFFKYAYFFDETLSAMLKPVGVNIGAIPFEIVLPLGISFFVFEFIHYVVDVYKGSEPVRSFLGFSLFASFFPTQIAGPIKRYQDFVPQFLSEAKFSTDCFDEGISLILLGLFKKVMIADNLSFFVQGGYSNPNLFTGLDLWIFTYAFAFQIYFDFSGYTDIARGSAKLFGYKVPINFNLPYIASNVAEFWHRWHISLSTWLRDYLYIPLGGSKCSKWMNYRNLFLTMALGGLWHGAAMHYLFWGAYQGIALIVHKEFQSVKSKISVLDVFLRSSFGKAFSVLLTFHAVCIGWVLFRAETTESCFDILRKMLFIDAIGGSSSALAMNLPAINHPLIYPSIYLLLPLLMAGHFFMNYVKEKNLLLSIPKPLKAAYCFAMIFVVLAFSPDKSPRFIYFQF
jgi:D-alanyl-lipoteichoic acid acyltransferase DltB (MBOAT superfamily)